MLDPLALQMAGQRLAAMWLDAEDAPLSVGIVFDISGSMGAKLGMSRQAVAQFLRTSDPEDEFFLVEFNDSPSLAVGLTSNGEDIQNRLIFTQAKGGTALLDGIYLAVASSRRHEIPGRPF